MALNRGPKAPDGKDPRHMVRLLTDHEDDGKLYKEGDLLTVDTPTRDFLESVGVIKPRDATNT